MGLRAVWTDHAFIHTVLLRGATNAATDVAMKQACMRLQHAHTS